MLYKKITRVFKTSILSSSIWLDVNWVPYRIHNLSLHLLLLLEKPGPEKSIFSRFYENNTAGIFRDKNTLNITENLL